MGKQVRCDYWGNHKGCPYEFQLNGPVNYSLAEQLTALAYRVAAIEGRLEPVTITDGVCFQYSQNQLQREPTNYLDALQEDVDSLVTLKSVRYNTESGLATYHFEEAFTNRSVTETWNGFKFIETDEWVES